jgi:hypothetical protein
VWGRRNGPSKFFFSLPEYVIVKTVTNKAFRTWKCGRFCNLKNPSVLCRKMISRSRENPGDLENGYEYFRYVMQGRVKKDHKEIKKRWEYFLG